MSAFPCRILTTFYANTLPPALCLYGKYLPLSCCGRGGAGGGEKGWLAGPGGDRLRRHRGWHTGALPDARMRQHAAKRGCVLTSRARQVRPADFAAFDLILIMDEQNRQDLGEFVRQEKDWAKVRLFCDFVENRPECEVPDPYYGGPEGFEMVLDLVENGCQGILAEVMRAGG
jgi:protein-tyrosine phosphatase